MLKLLDLHIASLELGGKAQGTIIARKGRCARFIGYLLETGQGIYPESVNMFLESRACTAPTLKGYWREIKAFWRWAARNGYAPAIPDGYKPRIDGPARTRLYPSQAELLAMLKRHPKSGFFARRDHALYHLIYWTAARSGEALRLRTGDVDLRRRCINLWAAKTHSSRTVPIARPLAEILIGYLGHVKGAYLFPGHPSQPDKPAGVSTVSKNFAQFQRSLGVQESRRLRVHDLRHCHGRHARAAGMDLLDIRDVLGHSSVKTTEIYTAGQSDSILERMEKSGFALAI